MGMSDICNSVFNKKNVLKAFVIACIITITALVVTIINHKSQASSSVSDEYNLSTGQDNPPAPDGCFPDPESGIPQFIIGYGSLMQTASKQQTYPNTTDNIPVSIHGFSRHWNSEGTTVGFGTTFLGVQRNNTSVINGVIFRLPSTSHSDLLSSLENYDKRERFYCRLDVPKEDITVLVNTDDEINEIMNSKNKSAQFWIYNNRPTNSKPASARYPIVQSYVDVFISGCLELQKKFKLAGFAEQCVSSTIGWGKHWVNDRMLPRRPWVFSKMAGKIDRVLANVVPKAFNSIKIEG